MAEKLATFPMLPLKSWYELRLRFRNSIPTKVTASYLASVLKMSEGSAKYNVLPYLRVMGLIDNEDKPTPLASGWRFDEKYADVCKQIRSTIYDQELLDTFPQIEEDRTPIENWFASKTKTGNSAAKRMATLFVALAKADPSEADSSVQKKPSAIKPQTRINKPVISPKTTEAKMQQPSEVTASQSKVLTNYQLPSLHIDIQVHISPEAKPEQIDKVFESMSKHLKDLYAGKIVSG